MIKGRMTIFSRDFEQSPCLRSKSFVIYSQVDYFLTLRFERNDLRTWSCAAGPHQRVRSRRSTMKQQLAEGGVPKQFGTKHNAKSH